MGSVYRFEQGVAAALTLPYGAIVDRGLRQVLWWGVARYGAEECACSLGSPLLRRLSQGRRCPFSLHRWASARYPVINSGHFAPKGAIYEATGA